MPEFKKACFCDSKRAYPKDKVLLDQKVYDAIRKEHEAQIGFDVVQTEKKHAEKEAQTLSREAIKAKESSKGMREVKILEAKHHAE